MVSPVIYDEFGREQLKYLPYTSPGNDGSFKMNPFIEQAQFCTRQYPGEQFFFGQTYYDGSPLNQVQATAAPGNSWVEEGNTVNIDYLVNTTDDDVVIWNIGYDNGDVPVSAGSYKPGSLFVTVTTDENANQVIEYKDLLGHIILKKVQAVNIPTPGHDGWLCTYYVYDDLNNLRFVIQPEGTKYLSNNRWTFDGSSWASSNIAQQQCFSYEYDELGRMIIKRVPGAGETSMDYDGRNRLIITQDANLQAQNKWLITNYDNLNRPILTGLVNNFEYNTDIGILATNQTHNVNPSNITEILTQTFYDDYSQISGTGSGLSTQLVTSDLNNTDYFYTPSNTSFPYPQPITANYQLNNQVTGTVVEVLGQRTPTYLYTVNFYDDHNRLIQTQSTNFSGGTDTYSSQYSFSGQVLRTLEDHNKGGDNPQHYDVLTQMQYDAMGRLLITNKKAGTSPMVTIAQNQYNELGQLKQKSIGQVRSTDNPNTYTNTPIDIIKYDYNIRGWLSGINKDYADGVTGVQNWFGEDISYDKGFTQNQLNGNIAGIKWCSGGDGNQRAYGYSYDNANRLTEADFTQFSGAWNTSAGIDFTTSNLTFDLNGNILTMKQMGLSGINSSSVIDDLQYGYNANSNQLNYVTDNANNTNSVLGDFKEINNDESQDYTYDGNGNLTQDNNKGINAITYNYLNLPQAVTVTREGTITYTYDAAGNKLRKVTVDNSTRLNTVTTTTDYIGPFVYQNDVLQYISQEEGRIRPASTDNTDVMYYDYTEKDHLGNTRAMLTDQQQADIYPVATMEESNAANENLYYDNVDLTRFRIEDIPDFPLPADVTYGSPNENVAETNGSGNKIGPSITLRVMAGDQINIHVADWYNMGTTSPGRPQSPLTDILSALENSVPLVSGASQLVQVSGLTDQILTPGMTGFLSQQTSQANQSKPQAFLNWVLFDDQFNVVMTGDGNNSGFLQIGDDNTYSTLVVANKKITKCGYLYVYVNNETPNIDVFFDNFQVTDTRGPLLETDNYYPFGLAMAGIDDQAAGILNNKYKYNQNEEQRQEFSDGTGLETIDFNARMYDAQIGRFWQIDPFCEYMRRWSPYEFSFDNPILYNDPKGRKPGDTITAPIPVAIGTDSKGQYELEATVTVYGQAKSNSTIFWSDVGSFLYGALDYVPFAGSLKQIGEGIGNGSWAGIGMGIVSLGVDVFTGGEGGEALRVGEEVAEHALANTAVKAEEEVAEQAEKEVAKTARTKSSEQLRKEWEEGTGEKWPKEPDDPTKNQHAHHTKPLADGGQDGYPNVEPLPAKEHRALHKNNGDFQRWGSRAKPKN
jgi:RHS repeat-associated protein